MLCHLSEEQKKLIYCCELSQELLRKLSIKAVFLGTSAELTVLQSNVSFSLASEAYCTLSLLLWERNFTRDKFEITIMLLSNHQWLYGP